MLLIKLLTDAFRISLVGIERLTLLISFQMISSWFLCSFAFKFVMSSYAVLVWDDAVSEQTPGTQAYYSISLSQVTVSSQLSCFGNSGFSTQHLQKRFFCSNSFSARAV